LLDFAFYQQRLRFIRHLQKNTALFNLNNSIVYLATCLLFTWIFSSLMRILSAKGTRTTLLCDH